MTYTEPNDLVLKHYGVIGMKWGVRKARKSGTTYNYKSSQTRKYETAAAKAKEKGNTDKYKTLSKRAKRSGEFDKKLQKVATDMSVGETAVNLVLNGPFATKSYASAKAYGASSGSAFVTSAVTNVLVGPVGNIILSNAYRNQYIYDN